MNHDLAKDRLITHAVTNYLAAAYQGIFSFSNILGQLEHSEFSEPTLITAQKNLSKVHAWTAQLFQDECLLSASWTSAESFEAQDALAMLDQLKPSLYEAASSTTRVLSLASVPESADIGLILALHARHAYSRDTYVRGFLEYGERFSLIEMQKRYEGFLPELTMELQRNQQLLAALKKANGDRSLLPNEFFPLLFQTSVALPAFFRSHIHDINQLLSQFKGGLTWTTAEFTKAETDLWTSAGLGPAAAGYFRAFAMGPEEAGAWRDAGIFDATAAIDWKRGGFSPESSAGWIKEKIPPPLAFIWSRSNYTPEEAKEFLEKGTMEPPPKKAAPVKSKPPAADAKTPPKKMSYPKKM